MKKLDLEIAEKITAWLETKEVKEVLEATEKAVGNESGTFEVVITTENLDRYQEVIKLDGWELEHYLKNPVVLWGHDHQTLPVGVATSIEVVDGKMIAKGKFAPHAHAQEIRKLYDLGILRATSVGFIEKEREGNLITKAELIEFSFVSVPANPYALSLALEKELGINELITRGFLNVKTTEPAEPEEPETPEEEPEVPGEAPETPEKAFVTKNIPSIVKQLKDLAIALEALTEPERDEEPTVETPEEKGLKEFSEQRKILQVAATIIGEVLAETRKVIEEKHKK